MGQLFLEIYGKERKKHIHLIAFPLLLYRYYSLNPILELGEYQIGWLIISFATNFEYMPQILLLLLFLLVFQYRKNPILFYGLL